MTAGSRTYVAVGDFILLLERIIVGPEVKSYRFGFKRF
jgi:hypothetical protein